MPRHLPIVALELRIAGWLVAAPSLLATLALGGGAFALRHGPTSEGSHSLDIKTYGVAALLENGAQGVATALGFLADGAAWLITGLTLVFLATTLIGVSLCAVGRAIQRGALWARLFAILIFLMLAPAALGALSVTPPTFAPIGWLLIGGSLYSLWVLVWRFE